MRALSRRRVVQLPKPAFAIACHRQELLHQFDGLYLRVRLQNGHPADHFFPFGEGSIGDRYLPSGLTNARAKCAWQAAVHPEKVTGLHPLLDQLSHPSHFFLRRWRASLRCLVDAKESHCLSLFLDSRFVCTALLSKGRGKHTRFFRCSRHDGRCTTRAGPGACAPTGAVVPPWYKMTVMLQSGLDIAPVITHRFHYTEFEQGFEVMSSGQSGKVILNWQ